MSAKKETRKTNYATQLPSQNLSQQSGKTSRDPSKINEKREKVNFGQTQPTSQLNLQVGKLEIDTFEQSLGANYRLDSFRAFGKPFCTSTKGGQRYDKNNLLVSQSMNNLDQVLDTQDSRPSQTQPEPEKPKINRLNLDKVVKKEKVADTSLTESQLNAPRAGRLPTSSDCNADSVNIIRSEVSDSLTPDDYIITKDDNTT